MRQRRPDSHKPSHRSWGILTLAVVLLVTSSGLLQATSTPKPDSQARFPQPYLDFYNAHPELFLLKRGWRARVDEARRTRERLLGPGGDTDKLIGRLNDSDLDAMSVTGTIEVPVVPVLFTPNTVPAPPTANEIDQILFTGPNATGTVTEYYDEVSYGLLNLTGTVFGFTTLPQNDAFYEDGNNGLPERLNSRDRVGRLMRDALNTLDATADFGQFDNDGPDGVPNSGDDDGFVDLISFLHPESGGECGNANIWAHRWQYAGWWGAPFNTNDAAAGGGNIQIDDYNIQGALTCANGDLQIGTFAHETGHVFGIPDLYDAGTGAASQGVGEWSLMGAGNWNTQTSPAHMSAWEKAELGWLVPTLLTAPVNNLIIPQVETNATAFQVVVGNGEYFLIENRQPVGFDQNLRTCGLAIWHVDQSVMVARAATNTVNAMQNCGIFVEDPNQHYGLALEQADGLCQLEGNFNRGDAGDLFPGSASNTTFTGATNPDSDSYISGPTLIRVENISNCGASMTADVDAWPGPSTVDPVDFVFLIDNTGSYTNDWPNIQGQMAAIVNKLNTNFTNLRYGLALFRDFPFNPFGSGSDFAYRVELALTSNSATFLNAIANLQAPGGGWDLPESQYEAMHQVLFGLGRDLFGDGIRGNQVGEIAPSNIGWVTGRDRVIYLLTDASFHDSDTEDYPTGTSNVPTPTLEAEGRNAVRTQIANLQNSGVELTIFTFVAEHHGTFVTQGQDGSLPPTAVSDLVSQASELTDMTNGGVMFVGPDSSGLTEAIETSVEVLLLKPDPGGTSSSSSSSNSSSSTTGSSSSMAIAPHTLPHTPAPDLSPDGATSGSSSSWRPRQ